MRGSRSAGPTRTPSPRRVGRGRSRLRRGAQAAAVRHRRRPGCGCPRRRRWRRRGCPARTCAACGRCRCWSSPAATASTARSRRSSKTLPTPRSRSSSRRRRSSSRSSSGPSRCSTAGCPSFAVDTDGTLHTSLMRSCTGWPSGRVDRPAPRRTAPDGSNFQLQHWTHTFDYAVVTGDGDWRSAADPAPQRGVLAPAARRWSETAARRRIAQLGFAAGDRARGRRAARRAQGGGQPVRIRQRRAVDPPRP